MPRAPVLGPWFWGLSLWLAAGMLTGSALAAAGCAPATPMRFHIARVFRRNIRGFTEGLEVRGGEIFESTGPLFGDTRLMRMDRNGHVTVIGDFGTSFFGEGLTILDDRIYQLSWKDHLVFVYDLKGELVRTMSNPREGWGLTHENQTLVFSDGSDQIFFASPKDFSIEKSIAVRDGDQPVTMINELEWVGESLYANVFESRDILRINPTTGCVAARANLDNLWDRMSLADRMQIESDPNFVLNGIAWDPARKMFYLTGKNWPMVFEGRFEDH